MKEEIKKTVYEIIKEIDISISEEKIISSKNLISDLGFDSLKMISFIVAIENKFKIEFDDDDLDITKLDSLENVLCIIENKCELRDEMQ